MQDLHELLEKPKALYAKHAKWVPPVFFVAGFIFDALLLQRIDDHITTIQQLVYLTLSGWLIILELKENVGRYDAGVGLWSKAWKYREAAVHFVMGTLLNAYTIFYFKSASFVTSFFFVGFLVVVIMLNEFKRFGDSQTSVHVAFWSLCLLSFSTYMIPTLLGFIGVMPFLLAMFCSATICTYVFLRLRLSLPEHKDTVDKTVLLPFVGIHVLFGGLYFAQAIPPVPLSVSYMGIYHGVKKEQDTYLLTYSDTSWKLWGNGDVNFKARPEDKIYCFARIFSPTNFKDQLVVRWLLKDSKRGWQPQDAIPLPITGGREKGFRGYTVKSNYSPGLWRCQIETSDHREIGRLTFQVTADDSTEERALAVTIE